MLTPREKAQLGISLAQEAIVQLLNTQGNSALQNDIQDSLGLTSVSGTSNSIVGTLLTDMASRNIVQIQGQGNQTNVQLTASQSMAVGRGASSTNR